MGGLIGAGLGIASGVATAFSVASQRRQQEAQAQDAALQAQNYQAQEAARTQDFMQQQQALQQQAYQDQMLQQGQFQINQLKSQMDVAQRTAAVSQTLGKPVSDTLTGLGTTYTSPLGDTSTPTIGRKRLLGG